MAGLSVGGSSGKRLPHDRYCGSPIPNVVSPYRATDPLRVNPTEEVGIPDQSASTSDPAASSEADLARQAAAALDVENQERASAPQAPAAHDPAPAATDAAASARRFS